MKQAAMEIAPAILDLTEILDRIDASVAEGHILEADQWIESLDPSDRLIESVIEGTTGYLVTPGDEIMMSQRWLQVINDPQMGAELGAAGRKHVIASSSLSSMTDARPVSPLPSVAASLREAYPSRREGPTNNRL